MAKSKQKNKASDSAKQKEKQKKRDAKNRGSKSGKSKDNKAKKAAKPPIAENADKYDLYQRSVQSPETEVKMLRRAYKHAYGEYPVRLREDFCGAAAVCVEWVRKAPSGEAWGVDLDPEPLAWGDEHNAITLKDAQRERLHLVEGDVRTARTPKADVIAAQNFSFYCFKQRAELLKYFKAARRHLSEQGVLVLDMLGGPAVMDDEQIEDKSVDDFQYFWEQETFDPISHDALFHIHFQFKDGSRLDKAFSYDWRLWSLPEVRDLLLEAGFRDVVVYWEGADDEGYGNGVFSRRKKAPADHCWLAYVCGVK